MSFTPEEIVKYNEELKDKSPLEIVQWAVSKANKPVVTTNFRPYEASILSVCVEAKADMPVVWCDSGYNTPNTYRHAEAVFGRAMAAHKPDVWFTNLRKGQTALRDSLDILSLGKDGVLKVSPFYNYSDEALDVYLEEKGLPNEHKYFDPTKVLGNRECGLHTSN